LGEDLHVLAVSAVEAVEFSSVEQAVQALLRDAAGRGARLVHPYTARGRQGTEALLAALTTQPHSLRFVAGHVRAGPGWLVIAPVSLVFQEGAIRWMLQPWIDRASPPRASRGAEIAIAGAGPVTGPPDLGGRHDAAGAARVIGDYVGGITEALGELLLVGLRRADDATARTWEDLRDRGAALGLHRCVLPISRLADSLDRKRHVLDWDEEPAAQACLEVAALASLADAQLPA
jgi:hypothetical protein